MADKFVTKDSGQRVDFASGMRRDVADEKPNFALCLAEGVPFEDQLLTRWAALMQRGAKKYGDRNWELAGSKEELERFRSSALRHMMQWATGDAPEEDHAAAVLFNLAAYEATKLKVRPERTTTGPVRDSGEGWFTEKCKRPLRAGARVRLTRVDWTHFGNQGTVTQLNDTGAIIAWDGADTCGPYKLTDLAVIG